MQDLGEVVAVGARDDLRADHVGANRRRLASGSACGYAYAAANVRGDPEGEELAEVRRDVDGGGRELEVVIDIGWVHHVSPSHGRCVGEAGVADLVAAIAVVRISRDGRHRMLPGGEAKHRRRDGRRVVAEEGQRVVPRCTAAAAGLVCAKLSGATAPGGLVGVRPLPMGQVGHGGDAGGREPSDLLVGGRVFGGEVLHERPDHRTHHVGRHPSRRAAMDFRACVCRLPGSAVVAEGFFLCTCESVRSAIPKARPLLWLSLRSAQLAAEGPWTAFQSPKGLAAATRPATRAPRNSV
mmetsp:Transcript_34592/g.99647  ORF Transcript_34592/g.99647 Transcript_34592/m.99647 type:complete len:296 (+) Transcript_34592:844-1731(+)